MLCFLFDFKRSFVEEEILPRIYWFGLQRGRNSCEGKAGADFPEEV